MKYLWCLLRGRHKAAALQQYDGTVWRCPHCDWWQLRASFRIIDPSDVL